MCNNLRTEERKKEIFIYESFRMKGIKIYYSVIKHDKRILEKNPKISNKRKGKGKRGANFVKNNCLVFLSKHPPASSEHSIKIASEVAEFRPVVIKTRKKKKANFVENSDVVSRLVETINSQPV